MKCFKIYSHEMALSDELFKRIGAFNVTEPLNIYTYVSSTTLTLIRKKINLTHAAKYADKAQALEATRRVLTKYSPKICSGLPTNLIIVDTQSIIKARMDEQMVSELARERGQ